MRRILIDTDTGSDDAAALIMALKAAGELDVAAVTVVGGNVPLAQAVQNALMSIEVAGMAAPPVYVGCEKPLARPLVTATGVHGRDGMGDRDLIHPTRAPEPDVHAVDAMIQMVKADPGQLEIVAIGPATNVALAVMKAPEVMKQAKCVWSMGTAGFGPGNATPVAEFNVYVDAEAYSVLMQAGIPLNIVGLDISLGRASLGKEEMEELLASGKREAVFVAQSNEKRAAFNLERRGWYHADMPDAVVIGVMLWEDIVLQTQDCYGYVCTQEAPAYGQVIFDTGRRFAFAENYDGKAPNCKVFTKIDADLFRRRMVALLRQ